MKYWILILVAALGMVACKTTSFERGVLVAEGAKAVFDSPRDEEKFQRIKSDIVAALASERPITNELVMKYVAKLKVDFSPAFIQIVERRLSAELPDVDVLGIGALDDTRIREFLLGVSAAL